MLPTDFPHQPPKGFTYEIREHKTNIIGIWIWNHARFSYTIEPVKSIWGFYNTKKQCYLAPINHKRPGKTIDVKSTSAYSAMPLLKLSVDDETAPPCPAMISSTTQDTMTATFTDFVATQDARNTIELNIRKYCLMLCDALVDDFNQHHPDSDSSYKFYIESGRKYHKLIMETQRGSRSVHAFVDKKTGDLYKAASFKAPAKGVRFNLCIISDREWLLENADWAGGYLYKR